MFVLFDCLLDVFFFSSRRRHTRWPRDWSSDVCSSDLGWNVGQEAEWDSPVGSLRSASGEEIGSDIPAANFVAKWDGDLLSEIVDHDFDEDAGEGVPVVSKWDYENLEQEIGRAHV